MPSAPAENPGSEAEPAAVVEWAAVLLAAVALGSALELAAAGAVGLVWDAVAAAAAELAPPKVAFPTVSPHWSAGALH